jgi:hypothetical protein
MTSDNAGAKAAISLPKGGGAIKGIGETFQPNLFTGTGNFSVPIVTSPGRNGFGPQLTLQYSTGNGNGPFGLGWQLSLPRVTRKTEKGLPKYTNQECSLCQAEDLVQVLDENGNPISPRSGWLHRHSYCPRRGLFVQMSLARSDDQTKCIGEPRQGERDQHLRQISSARPADLIISPYIRVAAGRILMRKAIISCMNTYGGCNSRTRDSTNTIAAIRKLTHVSWQYADDLDEGKRVRAHCITSS